MLGKILWGSLYAAVPVVGWIALYKSFKRVGAGEIASFKHLSGKVELLEEGIHFQPSPWSSFGPTFNKTKDYIDFGSLIRVRIRGGQVAYKTLANGELEELSTGIHIIDASKNETFDLSCIKSNQEDFLDFGAKKIVRIKPGKLGIKIDRDGNYIELQPGLHTIDSAQGELFDYQTGVQDIGQADFTLGNHRYVTIRNGELGESYLDGVFTLLKAGVHKLPANHVFVKKVPVNADVIDLGALKIITVKEGQVAIINTQEGVIVKGPGKHEIKQSEGNFFNTILTTIPQGVNLPTLTVMCSDQIEMRAESFLTFRVDEPLKTVGLGIEKIIETLKIIADGTLRTILSRFSSSDIAPSLHADEDHDSSKRHQKLTELHDECVDALDKKAKEWGLSVTDLQITQILPADDVYLKTIRNLGAQQSTAESNRRLAENEAEIARIKAEAERSRVLAAKIEQEEAAVRATTEAETKATKAKGDATSITIHAKAEAQAIQEKSNAEADRIKKLNEVAKDAPEVTQQVMLIEAQAQILKQIERPVFVQPGLGDTSILSRDKSGTTFFSTKQQPSAVIDALALQNGASLLQPSLVAVQQ